MNLNAQRGQSMWGNLFMIGMLLFVAITVMKLWGPYYSDFAVAKAIENMKSDPVTLTMGAKELRESLNKRLEISAVTLAKENVDVVKDENGTKITINYEVRLPLYGNIDGVVKFNHSLELASASK